MKERKEDEGENEGLLHPRIQERKK